MAQKELEVRNSLAPSKELRKWLQITYELELKAYNEKKLLAEQQLSNAKVLLTADFLLLTLLSFLLFYQLKVI